MNQKYCFVVLKLWLIASHGLRSFKIKKNSANDNLTTTHMPGIMNKRRPTKPRDRLIIVRIKTGHHNLKDNAIISVLFGCSFLALFAIKSIRAAV